MDSLTPSVAFGSSSQLKLCRVVPTRAENRIRILASIFAIDICAYAVMSNHLQIVVKLCPGWLDELTDEAIAERWTSLFAGPLLLQKWQKGESLKPAELQVVKGCISVYRNRLASLSWFMKCLNEPVARQANREDSCTGHFYKTNPWVLPSGPTEVVQKYS